MLAIVDTGPLFAWADRSDRDHDACLEVLRRSDLSLVIPGLVVAEAAFLIASRLGPGAEAAFFRALVAMDVEDSRPDFARIAELVETYRDFPLGGVDASVVATAERLGAESVVTLDRRRLLAVRPRHCEAFRVLP